MNKIKLFAGALTFMTTMAPPIHAYAATASHAELNAAEKNIDLDKSVNLQNSINLTDEIAKENQDSNIMSDESPTSEVKLHNHSFQTQTAHYTPENKYYAYLSFLFLHFGSACK